MTTRPSKRTIRSLRTWVQKIERVRLPVLPPGTSSFIEYNAETGRACRVDPLGAWALADEVVPWKLPQPLGGTNVKSLSVYRRVHVQVNGEVRDWAVDQLGEDFLTGYVDGYDEDGPLQKASAQDEKAYNEGYKIGEQLRIWVIRTKEETIKKGAVEC